MDFRNNAIHIDKITATDVNKTIQRSTAKAIAMHGLGLSLWTGEDVPELVEVVAKTPDVEPIDLNKDSDNWNNVAKYVSANKALGVTKIVQQLSRKYKISPAIKKEITLIINQD